MDFTRAMYEAYTAKLCIDFYSNTITHPEGIEWYWTTQGDDIANLVELVKGVVEGLEDKEC